MTLFMAGNGRMAIKPHEHKEREMFGKKRIQQADYDRENWRPVLKCSICNGEQVAGFKNIHTGQWEEVMLIKNEEDLETFKRMYDLKEVTKEY